MPDIFGLTGAALTEHIGSLRQVVRVDSFVEADGAARGARRLRLVNGGGLELEVHPDRALDLGQLTVDGIPLAWISPPGITAPEFYEASGSGWLRTFGGGLLATCGLDTFGPPCEDDGQWLGQHGRIGAQPAELLRAEATQSGVVVEGLVRQASVFGENLVLRRRIDSPAGSDHVRIHDVVTNEGYTHSPHMILYHANLGWPLVDAGATLDIPSDRIVPRDADAESGLGQWSSISAPVPGWREQLFRHDFEDTSRARATVTNPALGYELTLWFPAATLPCLYEWKMTGQGHYVLGLEPANCRIVTGRADARAAGDLPLLAPGESVEYDLEFRVRRIAASDPEPTP